MKPIELRIHFLLFAALSAAVTACAPLPAGTPLQSNASTAAPVVAVGDSWTYHVRDGFNGLERGTQRYRVVEVAGDRIGMTVAREGGGEESQIYDRGWNWLKHPATNLQNFDYSPAYPAFAFPLAPGTTWRARLTATDPVDGRRFPLTIDGVVLGWERIKVPAGEFDAIKVKRTVFFDYFESQVRGRSEILEYEWYAPAVKQAVRREASAMYLSFLYGDMGSHASLRAVPRGNDGGPRFVRDDWLISELVAYSVR
jgi:hypothetical protein